LLNILLKKYQKKLFSDSNENLYIFQIENHYYIKIGSKLICKKLNAMGIEFEVLSKFTYSFLGWNTTVVSKN